MFMGGARVIIIIFVRCENFASKYITIVQLCIIEKLGGFYDFVHFMMFVKFELPIFFHQILFAKIHVMMIRWN